VEGFEIGSEERELRTMFGPPNVDRPVNTSDLCTQSATNLRVLEYHARRGFVQRMLGTPAGLRTFASMERESPRSTAPRLTKPFSRLGESERTHLSVFV
jgi:hypothetical protein